MATAVMQIDVAGLPGVPAGEARTDGVVGSKVTVTSVGSGTGTHDLKLFSATDLSPPTLTKIGPTTWEFTPTTSGGHSYALELAVDDGGPASRVSSFHIYAIRSDNLDLPYPAPNEAADPTASYYNNGSGVIEASWNNEGGNYWGWMPHADAWLRQVDAYAKGYDGLPAADSSAWRLRQGSTDYVRVDTAAGAVEMDVDLSVTGNIAVTGTVDGVDVSAHAARHILGGADEIDGDQLDIDWNPTNYTPTTVPAEVSSLDHLTAHLAGIDNAIGGGGGGHTLQAAYNGGSTILLSGGAAVDVTHENLAGANHAAVRVLYSAQTYTAQPDAFLINLTGAAGFNSASDIHGIRMLGAGNAGAGDSIGLYIDSGWDQQIQLGTPGTTNNDPPSVWFHDGTGTEARYAYLTFDAAGSTVQGTLEAYIYNGVAEDRVLMLSGENAFSVQVGSSTNAPSTEGVQIGWNANAGLTRAIAIGRQAAATQSEAIAIGAVCNVSAARSIGMGRDTDVDAADAVAIGYGNIIAASHTYSVTLGRSAVSSAANQFVVGSGTGYITEMVIGARPDGDDNARAATWRVPDGNDTFNGWSLLLRSGNGGAGDGVTAGGDGGPLTLAAGVGGADGGAGAGAPVGIIFQTDATERFQIDGSGAWLLASAPGGAGEVLTSNGAGAAPTWQAAGGGVANLQGAYDGGNTIQVAAGNPVALTHSATATAAHPALSISYDAQTYTSQPDAFLVTLAGAVGINSASDVHGIRLEGAANAGAGDTVGVSVDSAWDVSLRFAGTAVSHVVEFPNSSSSALAFQDAAGNIFLRFAAAASNPWIQLGDPAYDAYLYITGDTANPNIWVRQSVGEDANIRLDTGTAGRSWIFGLDDSTTNNDFVMSHGTALGTDTAFSIDGSTFVVDIPRRLSMSGGIQIGNAPTLGAIGLRSVVIGDDHDDISGNDNILVGNSINSQGHTEGIVIGNGTLSSASSGGTRIGWGGGSAQTQGISIGNGNVIARTSAVVIGSSADGNSRSVAIGAGAGDFASGSRTIAVGYLSRTQNADYAVSIGYVNDHDGRYGVSIGAGNNVDHDYCIVLGYNNNGAGAVQTTAANQFIVGSANGPITAMYVGEGITSTTPQALTWYATGASGTDVAAANLIVAGGRGTGTGAGGQVIVQVAPASTTGSSLNSLNEAWRADPDAYGAGVPGVAVGGPSSCDAKLHVLGDASLTGRLVRLEDDTNVSINFFSNDVVAYSWAVGIDRSSSTHNNGDLVFSDDHDNDTDSARRMWLSSIGWTGHFDDDASNPVAAFDSDHLVGYAQTTDNTTWTTILSVTVRNDYVYGFDVAIEGGESGGGTGDAAYYKINGAGKASAGSAAVVGTTNIIAVEDDSTWNVRLNANSDAIEVQVLGDDTNTVNWKASARVYRHDMTTAR